MTAPGPSQPCVLALGNVLRDPHEPDGVALGVAYRKQVGGENAPWSIGGNVLEFDALAMQRTVHQIFDACFVSNADGVEIGLADDLALMT